MKLSKTLLFFLVAANLSVGVPHLSMAAPESKEGEQTNETKIPSTVNSEGPQTFAPPKDELRSAYLASCSHTLGRFWHPVKGKEFVPVLIRFTIDEEGKAKNVVVTKSSGQSDVDRTAFNAILDASGSFKSSKLLGLTAATIEVEMKSGKRLRFVENKKAD